MMFVVLLERTKKRKVLLTFTNYSFAYFISLIGLLPWGKAIAISSLYSQVKSLDDQVMNKLILSLSLTFYATSGFTQNIPSCPDRGSDPSVFCLPGTTWDEATKSCVGMA